MSFIAVGIGTGIATIGGAVIGANAAGDAADKQTAASNYATDVQHQQYEQTRKDLEPWRRTGEGALSKLGSPDYMRDFTVSDFSAGMDPGYQFRMQEGQKAIERSAAARGGLNSGGTMKAISRYGQDYASNEYQNAYNRFNADRDRRFNRLSSLAGLGQTANSQTGQAGMNYATQAGQNAMGAANAQGAAGMYQANQWGNTLGGLGKTWMDYAMMSKMGVV